MGVRCAARTREKHGIDEENVSPSPLAYLQKCSASKFSENFFVLQIFSEKVLGEVMETIIIQ
jgi:hypothetical protein